MQHQKRVVREIFEDGWNQQKFDSFEKSLADRIVFNFRGARVESDLEDLKSLVSGWHNSFSSFTFNIVGMASEGDIVAANLLMTGTHTGLWKDLLPTGHQIRVGAMFFFRFADSLLVEVWEVFDEYELRRQLAAREPTGSSG